MIMTTHFAVLLLLFASTNFILFLFLKNLAALFYKQCICNITAVI